MNDPIRTVLLTTRTAHHTYYAFRVHLAHPWQSIVVEQRRLEPRVLTAHPFESERDRHEREILQSGCPTLEEVAPVHEVETVNDGESVEILRRLAPEVVIVFGTGKLLLPVIGIASRACLNLHGGDPEHYRGLDSHLWSIYHDDFDALKTALHHVDEHLDTGPIVGMEPVPLHRSMGLHELRAASTRLCVDLSVGALGRIIQTGAAPGRRQRRKGRYFSSMSCDLKEVCVRKFEEHTSRL